MTARRTAGRTAPRPAMMSELARLRALAEAGFSRAEASRMLGRHIRFAYDWAERAGIEWRPRRERHVAAGPEAAAALAAARLLRTWERLCEAARGGKRC